MGSFIGHAIPGGFFILMGIWWTVQPIRRYFLSLYPNATPFRHALTGTPRLDGIVVVVMCLVGGLVESLGNYIVNGGGSVSNIQHITMYGSFGFFGTVILVRPALMHIVPSSSTETVAYLTLGLAFVVEALLFRFHVFGDMSLVVLMHTFLFYSALACSVGTLAEPIWGRSVLASLSRPFFTLLQGTWFWQIGFTLHNPFATRHPDHDLHRANVTHSELRDQLLWATNLYAWHMWANFGFIAGVGLLAALYFRRPGGILKTTSRGTGPTGDYSILLSDKDEHYEASD